MAPEPGPDREPRELRLEGFTLALAGGILLALLFGAFELGRAVERWSAPARASSPGDPLGALPPEPTESQEKEKPTFFDTTSAPGQEAEPKREARSTATTAAPPASAPQVSSGPWYVQVFVGRDRAAAEEVVRTLKAHGYPVRTDAVAEGKSDSLYKVRVGGYATKDAADAGAEHLHKDGQASTWVVKVGG
jgi:cell division protein FtsN